MDSGDTNPQSCRAFYYAASLLSSPSFPGCTEDCVVCSLQSDLPTVAWLPMGNDAILVGYNEAMVLLTEGGITRALGVSASDMMIEDSVAHIRQCARTHADGVYELVRRLLTGGGTWRLLSLVRWHKSGVVTVNLVPVERLDEVPEKVRV